MRAIASTDQRAAQPTVGRPADRAADRAALGRRLLSLSRLILPATFFGYGLWANLDLIVAGRAPDLDGSVVRGEVTDRLTRDYARAMPHRDAAADWLGAARFALLGEGRPGVVVGRDGWLYTDEEMVVATDADVARMVGEARAARDALAAAGARLVVVPLPAKVDVARQHGPDARISDAMAEQHARFMAALAAAGVDAVDARPALVALGARAFLARDTHWRPEGAAAVAGAVAASGLVEPGPDAFARRDGAPVAVTGDLVHFVTSDAIAARMGLGPETVTPYVAEAAGGAGGIFAADAAPIGTVLVGTSYSADERWSFAPALTLALGRDVLDLAEKGQGPVRPLRALLADPARGGAAPDLVIWEVPVRYLADPTIWPDDADAPANGAAADVLASEAEGVLP